jgi:hypothetical protein
MVSTQRHLFLTGIASPTESMGELESISGAVVQLPTSPEMPVKGEALGNRGITTLESRMIQGLPE